MFQVGKVNVTVRKQNFLQTFYSIRIHIHMSMRLRISSHKPSFYGFFLPWQRTWQEYSSSISTPRKLFLKINYGKIENKLRYQYSLSLIVTKRINKTIPTDWYYDILLELQKHTILLVFTSNKTTQAIVWPPQISSISGNKMLNT